VTKECIAALNERRGKGEKAISKNLGELFGEKKNWSMLSTLANDQGVLAAKKASRDGDME